MTHYSVWRKNPTLSTWLLSSGIKRGLECPSPCKNIEWRIFTFTNKDSIVILLVTRVTEIWILHNCPRDYKHANNGNTRPMWKYQEVNNTISYTTVSLYVKSIIQFHSLQWAYTSWTEIVKCPYAHFNWL